MKSIKNLFKIKIFNIYAVGINLKKRGFKLKKLAILYKH